LAAPKISQYQFQGFTNQTAYNPLQLPDPSRLAESNIAALKDMFRQQEQEGVKQFLDDDNFAKIAKFIPSATKAILQTGEYVKGVQESWAEEQFYQNEDARLFQEAQYSADVEVPGEEAHQQELKAAMQAAAQGGDMSHVEFLQNLSGHSYRKYSELYLGSLGESYDPWMETELLQNDGMIDLPGGPVKINDPDHTPQIRRAVRSHLRQEFFKQKGLNLAHPGAKSKFTYRGIDKVEATRDKEFTKQYNINRSYEVQRGAESLLLEGRIQEALNTVMPTYNDKGKRLGAAGGLDWLQDTVESMAAAGMNTNKVMLDIYNMPVDEKRAGKKGVVFGEFNARRFNEMASAVRKKTNEYYTQIKKDGENQVTAAFMKINAMPYGERTQGFYNQAAQELTELRDRVAPLMSDEDAGIARIKEMANTHSISGAALNDLREDLDQKIAANVATADHPYFLTQLGMKDAERLKAVKDQTPYQEDGMKEGMVEIKSHVSGNDEAKIQIKLDGTLAETYNSLAADLQRDYQSAYVAFRGQGMNQEEAKKAALTAVKDQFAADKKDKESTYYTPDNGKSFPNYYKFKLSSDPEFRKDVRWHTNTIAENIISAPGGWKRALLENAYLGGNLDEIQAEVAQANTTGRASDRIQAIWAGMNERAGKTIMPTPMHLLAYLAQGHGLTEGTQFLTKVSQNFNKISPEGQRDLQEIFMGNRPNIESHLRHLGTTQRGIFKPEEPLSTFRSQVSSITFEDPSGQPGIDVFFEDKKFPAVLSGVVKDIIYQVDANGNGFGHAAVVESVDPETGKKVDVLYSHLATKSPLKVGQQIQAGELVGTQGGTGSVRSADGTIASIDFLAPAPQGSSSMVPYSNYDSLRRRIAAQLGYRGR
jgi:hypothetical protein